MWQNGQWLWSSSHLAFPLPFLNNCLGSSVDRCEAPACGGLGGVLAGHMERPVCGIEALFYQFQCSTCHHLGSVGW